MLEYALVGLGEGSEDEHVRDLAERVRSLMMDGNHESVRRGSGKDEDSEMKMQAVKNEIDSVKSGEDCKAGEETEKV